MISPSSSYKKQLDTIDHLRSILRNLKDVKFYEEINKELPVFILLGAQSSGKSSIITRITKGRIKLPTAAGMCTRVVTEIRLRSDKAFQSVTLEGPNAEDFDGLYNTEEKDICSAVAKCQEKAIELAGGTTFATEHTIVIKLSAKDLPNITILDMPGFNLRSPDATEQVLKLARDRVENYPGSLILHVMRADIDSETIVGSDFINNCKRTTITVLTYLDKQGCEEYLEKTASNSNMILYGVLGNFEGTQEEEKKKLSSFYHLKRINEIGLGSKKLVERLEEEMKRLLEEKIPGTYQILKTAFEETKKELSLIPNLENPNLLIFRYICEVKKGFSDVKKNTEYANEMRQITETICSQIKKYSIESDFCGVSEISDYKDLKKGDKLYFRAIDDPFTSSEFLVGEFEEYYLATSNIRMSYLNEKGIVYEIIRKKEKFSRLNVYEDIKLQIKNMIDDERGFKNESMVGNYNIVEVFTKKFSKFCVDKIENFMECFLEEANSYYSEIISSQKEEIFAPIVSEVTKLFNKILNKKESELKKFFSRMQQYNEGRIVNTTNTHYLTANYAGIFRHEDEFKNDDSEVKGIAIYLEAFIKVQKKFIQELISKEIQLSLMVELEREFLESLDESFDKLIKCVKKPEKLVKRKKVLEDKKFRIGIAIERMKADFFRE